MEASQKFKVLSVSEWYYPHYSGVGIRLARFCKRMGEKNIFSPHIVTRKVENTPAKEISGSSVIERIRIVFPMLAKNDGVTNIERYICLFGFVLECLIKFFWLLLKSRKKFDIIHAYVLSWFSILSLPVGKFFGKKTVIEITLLDGMLESLQQKKTSSVEWLRRSALACADVVVTHSPFITDLAVRGGIAKEKIFEVPNPVDINEYSPATAPEKKEIKKKLGITDDAFVLLFVGGISARKRVDILVDAFTMLAPDFPKSYLYLVGPTEKYDQGFIQDLNEKIRTTGNDHRVVFTEKSVNNVAEYMKASDLFVFASENEGFGTVSIEAMACGLPVVLKNIPLLSETQVTNGREGAIVYSNDVEKFAETIGEIMSDDEKRTKMGSCARKKAVDTYSTDRIDAAYIQMYQKLMQG